MEDLLKELERQIAEEAKYVRQLKLWLKVVWLLCALNAICIIGDIIEMIG